MVVLNEFQREVATYGSDQKKIIGEKKWRADG